MEKLNKKEISQYVDINGSFKAGYSPRRNIINDIKAELSKTSDDLVAWDLTADLKDVKNVYQATRYIAIKVMDSFRKDNNWGWTIKNDTLLFFHRQ